MICGVDEAGRGPVLGPLVVCGVSIADDSPLVELGVRDSKKLTRGRREELAPRIIELSSVEILEVPAEEIDSLRSRMTMNELEAMIFARIIDKLSPDVAYLDAADVNEDRFGEMTRSCMTCTASLVSKHKADDKYPVVSAASIIAKVTRDHRIGLIRDELGVEVGSGYTSDPVTRAFMQTWLDENGSLPPHVRRSWKTSQKIMNLNGIRRLDSFEG
ncbi:MAG TPA: ribonuclease HII [Thermoplasmata archaeon]|nr:ribonuclease HII [Thermoplasmata archaeon]